MSLKFKNRLWRKDVCTFKNVCKKTCISKLSVWLSLGDLCQRIIEVSLKKIWRYNLSNLLKTVSHMKKQAYTVLHAKIVIGATFRKVDTVSNGQYTLIIYQFLFLRGLSTSPISHSTSINLINVGGAFGGLQFGHFSPHSCCQQRCIFFIDNGGLGNNQTVVQACR